MFVQFYGGDGSKDESFNITIFNATLNNTGHLVPDTNLETGDDQTFFDFTELSETQPVSWHQANFNNKILNISRTKNNTFFAMFQVTEFQQPKPDGYFYYAFKNEEDKYESLLYKSIDAGGHYSLMQGKAGLLKVNLAPLDNNPTADQINLTVFNTTLDNKGKFQSDDFIPHVKNRFNIPISSPWFADVY
ncbi:MAG: hypothetical protein EU544_03055 [Promethearchaeota archaeon]|nr:MAG: hypothetical protein EU544_03055 [Candidatus Lokiarchaeota archaeon]